MLARVGAVGNETAQSQLELLAGFEAALRCAPELQRHFAPAVADLDVPTNFAASANHAALCCLRWAIEPGLQLTTDEAERLLAAAAALSCTICKCAMLWADTAAVTYAAGTVEAAQAATAGGGAGAAGAAPVVGRGLPRVAGHPAPGGSELRDACRDSGKAGTSICTLSQPAALRAPAARRGLRAPAASAAAKCAG